MNRFFLTCLLILTSLFSHAHTTSLRGYVVDARNNEKLSYVTVYPKGFDKGTMTDDLGNYTLNLPEGKVVLIVQLAGYNKIEQSI